MYISYEVMLGWKMMKNVGGQGRARALFVVKKKKEKREAEPNCGRWICIPCDVLFPPCTMYPTSRDDSLRAGLQKQKKEEKK
jgi:hypothetical protein